MKIFLTDNGSLRPTAIFSLRRLARELGEHLNATVNPASLLHTNRVASTDLDNVPAPVLEAQLKIALTHGEREFLVVPLFFGPSRAITEYLPVVEARLRDRFGDFSLQVARPLVDLGDPATVAAVGQMLCWGIGKTIESEGIQGNPVIILVDHGTPEPRVNAVRNALGDFLQKKWDGKAHIVLAASMERRPEPVYEFNEPLLEKALQDPDLRGHPVILSYLFLQPGRHAGPGGDIADIVEKALVDRPQLRLFHSPLVGECPDLIPLLGDRAKMALGAGDKEV